jgi:hypothetical protein
MAIHRLMEAGLRETAFPLYGSGQQMRDFTHVFVADQPALMIWRTLSHFEDLLPSPPFLRRSFGACSPIGSAGGAPR